MGRGDCDPCDNRDNRGINPADPRDLARELDRGNAGVVMDALQRDAYTMQPRQFQDIVRAVARLEDPSRGDNLAVNPNGGDIVVSKFRGRTEERFRIGNIFCQDEMARDYERNHPEMFQRQRPVIDQRREPQPYYGGQDRVYRPDVATPPFFPDEQYGRHGRNGRVFDPGFDPRFDNRRGYGDRQLGQEIIRDGVVGAIVGKGSGGDALKGAGINILLNQVFRPRGY